MVMTGFSISWTVVETVTGTGKRPASSSVPLNVTVWGPGILVSILTPAKIPQALIP